MSPTKPKRARRRGRPVSPQAQAYEAIKAPVTTAGLTPTAYARAVRRLARKAGI